MPDESINLIVTSPPYNKTGFRGYRDCSRGKGRWRGADIKYGDFLDDKDETMYQGEQVKFLDRCFELIKDDGSIFYNHKIRRAGGKASHPFEWINKSKAIFYQQIIWDRGTGVDHNVNYLTPTTELIFWLVKEKPKVFKHRENGEIWRIMSDHNNKHPAPFPITLVNKIILLTTDKLDVVFDPFLGSGTTVEACKLLKRNFIGIEINPDYCKIAEERLAQGVL